MTTEQKIITEIKTLYAKGDRTLEECIDIVVDNANPKELEKELLPDMSIMGYKRYLAVVMVCEI